MERIENYKNNLRKINIDILPGRYLFETFSPEELSEKAHPEAFVLQHEGNSIIQLLKYSSSLHSGKKIYKILSIEIDFHEDLSDLFNWLKEHIQEKLKCDIQILRETKDDKAFDYWCLDKDYIKLARKEIINLQAEKTK